MKSLFSESQKNRIPQLEGLRFIMCVIIIFSHFEFLENIEWVGVIYSKYFHNANLAVDYFFLLSGFGIYLSDKRPSLSFKELIFFAWRKIRKIYPVYLFSLFLATPITLINLVTNDYLWKAFAKYLLFLGLDLSLLQSVTGTTVFSHSINGVGWFLSTIFICYCICPAFLFFVDSIKSTKKIIISMFFIIGVIIGVSYFAIYLENLHLPHALLNDVYYGHPLIRCWYLLFGMLIACLFKKRNYVVNSFYEFGVLLVSLVWILMRNQAIHLSALIRIIDLVVCGLLIYVFASGGGIFTSLFSRDKIVTLGKKSIYLFLLHYPIRLTVGYIFEENENFLLSPILAGLMQVSLIIVVTVVIVEIFLIIERNVSSLKTRSLNEITEKGQ